MAVGATADAHQARTYPAKPADVYFFATCLIDQFAPDAGLDAIRLLEREGIRVHFPSGQTCCGQPAYTSGYPDEARAVAEAQMKLFPKPWPVIVPSGSCGAMMRHHYPKLFADDATLWRIADELSERVYELTEFLVHVVKFKRQDTGAPSTVALHTSCHARREMNAHLTSDTLLAGLKNVTVAQQARAEECCGFGGTFSIRHPAISEAMVTEKVESLCATGAERVVSADCGCLFNILGRAEHMDKAGKRETASLPGEHIASFLWRRTDGGAA